MLAIFRSRHALVGCSIVSAAGVLALRSAYMSSSTVPSKETTATTPKNHPTFPYRCRSAQWPYSESDFRRLDTSDDGNFYQSPRFVTHIDDTAIAALRRYYHAELPRKGRILDFCSSWVSHYPDEVEQAVQRGELRVVGTGMNQQELARNPVFKSLYLVKDLNVDPTVHDAVSMFPGQASDGPAAQTQASLDSSTCVVSIDYLVKPVQVLSSIREHTRPGGTVHLVVSNRCFQTKAVMRWLMVDEQERLQMVGDYLWFAGWRDINIVTLRDGSAPTAEVETGGIMNWITNQVADRDPLWVVKASNPDVHEEST